MLLMNIIILFIPQCNLFAILSSSDTYSVVLKTSLMIIYMHAILIAKTTFFTHYRFYVHRTLERGYCK